MSNEKMENRVLGRVNARDLSEDELNNVTGGFNVPSCTFNPKTCAMDGVCTPLPRCPV